MSQSSKPTPIAIPNDLAELIDKAALLSGLTKQDLMRLAMRIGLEDLRRCNYDIPGTIVDAAHAAKKQALPQTTSPHHQTASTAASQPPTTEAGKIISGPTPRQPDAGLATSHVRTTTPPPPNIVGLNEDPAEYGRPKKKKK